MALKVFLEPDKKTLKHVKAAKDSQYSTKQKVFSYHFCEAAEFFSRKND